VKPTPSSGQAIAAAQRESEFMQAVIDYAHLLSWRVAHFRPGRTARGWRTPVQADGAGWPDLVLLRVSFRGRHDPRLIFAELKAKRGRVTEEQQAWLDALAEVEGRTHVTDPRDGGEDDAIVRVVVWTPDDWPEIERTLA
jgi:hypothetical protein